MQQDFMVLVSVHIKFCPWHAIGLVVEMDILCIVVFHLNPTWHGMTWTKENTSKAYTTRRLEKEVYFLVMN